MLQLGEDVFGNAKLVEFGLNGMDYIVYHSTIDRGLKEISVLTPYRLLQTTGRWAAHHYLIWHLFNAAINVGWLATPEAMMETRQGVQPFYTTCKSKECRERFKLRRIVGSIHTHGPVTLHCIFAASPESPARVDGVVGYRICLTHRRSSVRTWVDSYFFHFKDSSTFGPFGEASFY